MKPWDMALLANLMLNWNTYTELYFSEEGQRAPLSLDKFFMKRQLISYEQMWLTTLIINDNNNHCYHLLSSYYM